MQKSVQMLRIEPVSFVSVLNLTHSNITNIFAFNEQSAMKYYPCVIEMDTTQKCSTLPKKLSLCCFSNFQQENQPSPVDSELFVQHVCRLALDYHWDG